MTDGGGYRRRAKGEKGVVVYFTPEDHATLLRALGKLMELGGRRVTLQECVSQEMLAWARRILAAGQPPPEQPPDRPRGRKRKGDKTDG